MNNKQVQKLRLQHSKVKEKLYAEFMYRVAKLGYPFTYAKKHNKKVSTCHAVYSGLRSPTVELLVELLTIDEAPKVYKHKRVFPL